MPPFRWSRSKVALAKLLGSTVVVLVPFLFAFLLASSALALSPDIGLQGEDWMRIASLMVVFTLYLTVFAAFGLWVSGLTHRRSVAFLGLLALWTVWIFVVPNLAVGAARRMIPAQTSTELQRKKMDLRRLRSKESDAETRDYFHRSPVEDWGALSDAQRRKYLEGVREVWDRWDTEFYSRVEDLQADRRNQLREQHRLAMLLSAISPMGAVSFVSMDLARTGIAQHERLEDAMNAYLISMNQFTQAKRRQASNWISRREFVDMSNFTWFTYRDDETLEECLSRSVFHILNLVLLAILGFSGAYVAILRYDVR